MIRLPEQLLNILGMDKDSLVTPLPGNANDNFLVKSGNQAIVVKSLKEHSAHNTEQEAMYRQYLSDSSLPVKPYIPLTKSSCVLELGGQIYVAIKYQDGQTPVSSRVIVTQSAKILARLHMLDTKDLPKRHSWYNRNYVMDALPLINDKFGEAKHYFALARENTPDFWHIGIPQGIVHGDLHEGNLVVDDDNKIIGVIDWEETSIEPLVLDIAHAAYELCFDKTICNTELFDTYIKSYMSVRRITQQEKSIFAEALNYTILVISVWAHIKKSNNQMSDEMFERIGNYYKSEYIIPTLS